MAPPGVRSCPPSSIALIKPEQQGREFASAISEARTNPARISVDRVAATICLNLLSVRNHFVPAKSNRPAAQIRSFRQAATTQWRMAALQLAWKAHLLTQPHFRLADLTLNQLFALRRHQPRSVIERNKPPNISLLALRLVELSVNSLL